MEAGRCPGAFPNFRLPGMNDRIGPAVDKKGRRQLDPPRSNVAHRTDLMILTREALITAFPQNSVFGSFWTEDGGELSFPPPALRETSKSIATPGQAASSG